MVVIGVTGHRFLAEEEKVVLGVDEALRQVEEAFGRPLTVLSMLAEGADRLIVSRLLGRAEARLIVPLPLPLADYMTDFGSPASRKRFQALLARAQQVITLPPTATREAAYVAGGQYVLDRCDVLLAIWDGAEAQGTGGTAEIVSEARRRGLPLAWVHAGNRRPSTEEATTLGEEQGTVTFERFPEKPRG